MTTYSQLLKHKHKKIRKFHKSWASALRKCPQKKGLCISFVKESPKKPNSAKRSVVKLKIFIRKKLRVQIPGEGHKLARFNRVLIRGGRTRDLPGIKYRVIRGKYDSTPVLGRRNSISKYGLKAAIVIGFARKEIEELFKN